MQRLIQAGLFGAGLIPVKRPDIVERYNACLEQIGIARTALASFRVDGIGWSPEIAEEKKDPYYLSFGEPNDLAIIVSVNQYKRPIYFPRNSYDRALMRKYFDANYGIIADITLSTALWLDMEEDITRLSQPTDLLDVHEVTVMSSAGTLSAAAEEQKRLAAEYRLVRGAWSSRSLRERIRASARIWGDLSKRELIVPPLIYDDVRCFSTRAFGGTFLFRTVGYTRAIIIVENETHSQAPLPAQVLLYALRDEQALKGLVNFGLIDVDLELYRAEPDALERIREGIVADAITRGYPTIDYLGLTVPAKKKYLTELGSAMPEVYFELETLGRHLKDKILPSTTSLSREARLLLMHPARRVALENQELVWQLISKLQSEPADILRLYTVDKGHFFDLYKTWPEAKKAWAVEVIRRAYVPKMNQ